MTEPSIRREDARLLTGKGRYTADWNLPGQLHAFFLRSDRAHAAISAIDAAAARARPGVHLVLTGADLAQAGWQSLQGEEAVYDRDTGQLLTGSFVDYPMPRADWMRGIRCDEHPVPTRSNPLGAKGVGESGTSGSVPALVNAILDALRPSGIRQLDTPFTPDKLWRALRAARNG